MFWLLNYLFCRHNVFTVKGIRVWLLGQIWFIYVLFLCFKHTGNALAVASVTSCIWSPSHVNWGGSSTDVGERGTTAYFLIQALALLLLLLLFLCKFITPPHLPSHSRHRSRSRERRSRSRDRDRGRGGGRDHERRRSRDRERSGRF